MTDLDALTDAISRDGYDFVPGAAMRRAIAAHGALADWDAFAASWNDLGLDTYMADGGRYRKRRHATFGVSPGGALARKPHQPHYQSRDYNALNGGIARWFEPVLPAIADGATMQAILATCRALFDRLAAQGQQPQGGWHIEIHQFRIEARAGQLGQPTPEGRHQDGVDYVLVLLIGRRNIQRGQTTIHAPGGAVLGSFTLTDPLDAALVDDHRVLHGVTPVQPAQAAEPGFRDVLVVTFRRDQRSAT